MGLRERSCFCPHAPSEDSLCGSLEGSSREGNESGAGMGTHTTGTVNDLSLCATDE